MKLGIVYAGISGALWGFVILSPSLLQEFNPMLISCTRFALYGAVSLLIGLPMAGRLLRKLTARDVMTLVKLSLTGNLLCFALLGAAVQLAGVATAALINGVLPVTITVLGRKALGAAPLSQLVWPLSLVIAGVLCINVDTLMASATSASFASRGLGIVCAFAALACWSWFAIHNSRYLKQSDFESSEWSTLSGITTGLLAVLTWIGLDAVMPGMTASNIEPGRWADFWQVCLALAVFGSWLGNSLWNASTRRLPITLSGQLLVFETLFALFYGFVALRRIPSPVEAVAIVLLTSGVILAIRHHALRPAGGGESVQLTPQAVAKLDSTGE